MRKIKFENNKYYHIYNRGVDKRQIFMGEKDYQRFLTSIQTFNQAEPIESQYRYHQIRRKETEFLTIQENRRNSVSPPPLVEIIAYCLNPNHYHLLLKQLIDKGISKFMHKLGLSYPKYFNAKYDRSGSLLQGEYQVAEIKTDEHLCYISAYINGNAEIHKIAIADKWPWSSYHEYFRETQGICNKNTILNDFESLNEYKEYLGIVIKECQQEKAELKNLYLE